MITACGDDGVPRLRDTERGVLDGKRGQASATMSGEEVAQNIRARFAEDRTPLAAGYDCALFVNSPTPLPPSNVTPRPIPLAYAHPA